VITFKKENTLNGVFVFLWHEREPSLNGVLETQFKAQKKLSASHKNVKHFLDLIQLACYIIYNVNSTLLKPKLKGDIHMNKDCLLGVCFLLFTVGKSLRLFTVEEQKAKPSLFKEKGMISPPFETFESRDENAEGTILRLIEEEIGFPISQVEIFSVAKEKFNLIPGNDDIFTTYAVGILNGDPSQERHPKDTDIVFSGWKTMDELFLCKVRIETRPIFEHFAKNYLPGLLNKLSVTA
jgi:hypothetical protein